MKNKLVISVLIILVLAALALEVRAHTSSYWGMMGWPTLGPLGSSMMGMMGWRVNSNYLPATTTEGVNGGNSMQAGMENYLKSYWQSQGAGEEEINQRLVGVRAMHQACGAWR